jgi:recombinational DNA repair ATPase RecF
MPLLPGEGVGKDEERERFIDWLCFGPEREVGQSQADFARLLGVHTKTLTKWKKERKFRLQWEERLRETVMSPDIILDQLKVLHEVALHGEKDSDRINAITQYQKLTGIAAPDRMQVDAQTVGAREMSDEDLMAELQQRVDAKKPIKVQAQPKFITDRLEAARAAKGNG